MMLNNWRNVPEFRREQTFGELIETTGAAAVYKNTGVDDATQTSLNDYFSGDYICDKPARFIWLWHRALSEVYPVYIDARDAWAKRKAFEWFVDNTKDETTTHDGTFALDEKTKADLTREITRALEAAGKTITDTDTTGTRDTTGTASGKTTDKTTGETADNSKERNFDFAYPESNYTGGVIPYDLDNDPTVEFLSRQSDRVARANEETSSDSAGTSESNTTDSEKTAGTVDTTVNTTDTQNETNKQADNQTADRSQDTATHWTETRIYKGDNINALARELIEMIPATNFFEAFVRKLSKCFLQSFLIDEVEEGL